MSESRAAHSARDLFVRFYGEFRKELFLMHAFFIIQHSYVWASPIIIANLIDLAGSGREDRYEILIYYAILIFIMLALNIPSSLTRVYYQSRITRGVSKNIRLQITRQLQQLSLLFHDRQHMGRLQSKALRDIEVLEQIPRQVLSLAFSTILNILVAAITILIKAPAALIFFVVLVPMSVALRRYFNKQLMLRTRHYRETFEDMSTSFSDMINMIPVTRAHGLERFEIERVSGKLVQVFEKGQKFDFWVEVFSASNWVTFTLTQGLFLIGSTWFAMGGHITVGDVVLFNTFFATISGSILALLSTIPIISQATESAISISELLSAPDQEDNDGKRIVSGIAGDFSLQNVSFAYPGSPEPVIRNLSFNIRRGESIAFIGPSGCGKTTLLSLLLGFVRPTSGRILLDGVDMQELDLRSYRQHVGVVTQNILFFSGSIFDNVAYGNKEASAVDVAQALQLSCADEFIEELPDGDQTRLGEDGVRLSGGQSQRLAIARALVRDPRVLILDEATSALDIDTERMLQDGLNKIIAERTAIIVAHRLSTIRQCDRIIILENGAIVAEGTHEELLKAPNFYSNAHRIYAK